MNFKWIETIMIYVYLSEFQWFVVFVIRLKIGKKIFFPIEKYQYIKLSFTFVQTLGVPLILRAEIIPSKPEQRSCCVGKSKADIS